MRTPQFKATSLLPLFRRRRTGKGQFIEVAMRDGLTQLIGEHVLDYTLNQRVQSRSGNLQASMAPHGVFPCRGQDRWLAVAVRDDADWTAFCRAIGRSDLVADPDFATILARKDPGVRERLAKYREAQSAAVPERP